MCASPSMCVEVWIAPMTASDEKEEHVRAFRLGAKGVVLKDSARQTLMQAIHTVCAGQVWVDARMTGTLVVTP